MSAKTHPRLVGAFVLGAIALVLAAVVFFSAGGWFEKRERFSVYFPGSVRGLNPGAPVTFRGIKIGEVAEVKAVLTGKPDPLIQIEIVFEMMRDIVEAPPGVPRPFAGMTGGRASRRPSSSGAFAGSSRARACSPARSTWTSTSCPAKQARFSGLDPRYPELPTTPTAMEKMGDKFEQFLDKLAELPLDEMMEDVRKAIRSIREVLEAPELKGAIRKADRAMGELGPALADARQTLADARKLLDTAGSEVEGTGGSARETLAKVRQTLDRVGQTLDEVDRTVGSADEARVGAARTLEELERTLKALRHLLDYVQTHPEAVVLGKEKGKEK